MTKSNEKIMREMFAPHFNVEHVNFGDVLLLLSLKTQKNLKFDEYDNGEVSCISNDISGRDTAFFFTTITDDDEMIMNVHNNLLPLFELLIKYIRDSVVSSVNTQMSSRTYNTERRNCRIVSPLETFLAEEYGCAISERQSAIISRCVKYKHIHAKDYISVDTFEMNKHFQILCDNDIDGSSQDGSSQGGSTEIGCVYREPRDEKFRITFFESFKSITFLTRMFENTIPFDFYEIV